MRILIKGTDFTITPAINDYVEKKIGGLRKYLKRLDSPAVTARVEVGKITEHHKKGQIFRAEVNLSLPSRLLRVEEEGTDLYEAIDKTAAALKRQIIDFKKKIISRQQQPGIPE